MTCIHGVDVQRVCSRCEDEAKGITAAFWKVAESCPTCTHLPLEDAIICCPKCSELASKQVEASCQTASR